MAITAKRFSARPELEVPQYFEDETRAEIRKKLFHLTAFAHNILFLQAETVTGKTRFMQNFFDTYRENWHVAEVDARSQPRGQELFNELARVLETTPLDDNIDALREKMRLLERNDELLVIWIDHCELLSEDMIAALFAIYIGEHDRPSEHVRLLFSGRDVPDSLYRALKHFEITEDKFVILELPALNEEQTANYIMHTIRGSGAEPIKAFDESIIQRIYRQSRGQIGEINNLTAELLQQKAEPSVADYDQSSRSQFAFFKIVTASLVVAIIASLWIFKARMNSSNSAQQAEIESANLQQNELAIPPIETLPEPSDNLPPLDVESASNDTTSPVETPSENTEATSTTIPPIEAVTTAPTAVTPKIEEPAKQAVVIPATKTENVTKQVSKPTPVNEVRNSAWIKQQNPNAFTLQLVALSSERAAIDYIKEHGIRNDAAYFRVKRNNKFFYPVIYGNFTSRNTAQSAINSTKQKVKDSDPWLRSFASIQRELK